MAAGSGDRDRNANGGGLASPLGIPSIPLPAQFPRTFETRWFEQQADHFNVMQPSNAQGQPPVFKQKYLYNDTYWAGAGHPVIFYTGAEGSGVEAIWDHSGWIVETLAKNLSALVVFAEHRFFGASFPFNDTSCELSPDFDEACESSFWPTSARLGLLDEGQTLADYANLIAHLRDTLKAWDSPFIAVGGSLAGELTTYLRVRYPHLVDMGIASSAPVLGYPGIADEFGWYRVVTDAFRRAGGQACVDQIRGGFTQIPKMKPAEIAKTFNTCYPVPPSTRCASRQITELVEDWCGPAAEAGFPPQKSSINAACNVMKGAENPIEAWQRLLSPADGGCLNITWHSWCSSSSSSSSSASEVGAEAEQRPGGEQPVATPGLGQGQGYSGPSYLTTNGWWYLACTTEVHPISSNNVTDFLPPARFNPSAVDEWCQSMFNSRAVNAPRGFFPAARSAMRTLSAPVAFGMIDTKRLATTASRIIFSSGQNDPWSAQSITESLSPSLPAVVVALGAHHSDLGGPYNPVPSKEYDTASLVKTREFEIQTLRKWIAQVGEERARSRTEKFPTFYF